MVKVRDTPPLLPDGTIDIPLWLERVEEERTKEPLALIEKAARLAQKIGDKTFTSHGVSCFYQGLMMAEILHDLGLDAETIAAALIYDCDKLLSLPTNILKEELGESVFALILGIHKIERIPIGPSKFRQNENLRRLLLSIVEDIRVVLIKLAAHLCEMRSAVKMDETTKHRIAEETQEIYAPLANRLGIGQLKWELEDLSFRFLQPDTYKQIATLLDERRIDREKYVENLVQVITQTLAAQGIKAEVSGRVKHIYSIWKKMHRKGVGYNEIYDTRAIRIVVPGVQECYAALGTVHSLWQHIPREFDDYIANPKSNGYRSLHTAVIGSEGKTVEIQIRTPEMHNQAELGVAAHWRYKEGVGSDARFEAKLANLRQIIKWQEEWAIDEVASQELDTLRSEMFQDRIYVFTPKGEVMDLPLGASVLDFAYQVHSDIGNRCRGAKANGVMVPLTHVLKSGDQVEILTAKSGGPSRDWLNRELGYLKTARARAKVHQWFRKQDREQNIQDGRDLLERELKRLGVGNLNLDSLARQLPIASVEDMLAALGGGDLRLSQIFNAIQNLGEPKLLKTTSIVSERAPKISKTNSAEVIVSGVGNLLCQMARCCKPVPGDAIVGYITVGRGVSVHRQDCVNILQAAENKQNRIIQVEWGHKTQNLYAVDIAIHAYDRPDLLRDISAVLAIEKITIRNVVMSTNKNDNTADFRLSIEITGIELLGTVLRRIQQLPNVLDTHRVQQ